MKLIIPLFIFALPFAISAQTHSEFEEFKKDGLYRLDKQISLLNEARSCMSESTERSALESCFKKMMPQKEESKDPFKDEKEILRDETEVDRNIDEIVE